jgi:hypothetical protein
MSKDLNISKEPYSQEEKDQIINWLNTNWGKDKLCEMCGGSGWSFSREPLTIPSIDIGTFPMLGISCKKCGNVKFLLLETIGIRVPKAEAKSAQVLAEAKNAR